jgi:hypothetical protein
MGVWGWGGGGVCHRGRRIGEWWPGKCFSACNEGKRGEINIIRKCKAKRILALANIESKATTTVVVLENPQKEA